MFNNIVVVVSAQGDLGCRFATHGQGLVVLVVAPAADCVWASYILGDAVQVVFDMSLCVVAVLDADFGGDIREYHSHAPLQHRVADDNCEAYGYNLGHNNNRH